MMARARILSLVAAAAALGLSACSTVPVSGREQLSLVPRSTMRSTAAEQYHQFMAEHEVVEGTAESRMVKEVGGRIAGAVGEYFERQGMSDQLAGYRWEFNLVKDDQANAWAMPGGKVAVYTGILPITRDETGLAVVMAHEVAHAVAEHGNERVSQQLLTQLGGMALSAALTGKPQQTQQLWMQAFGAGAQYGVLLPYSRLQESEADELGLIFMAMAGYDPREAVDFWKRMAEKGGASPPFFLSTHPSDRQRIENIRKHLPRAMEHYR